MVEKSKGQRVEKSQNQRVAEGWTLRLFDPSTLRLIIREPLVHFALLGSLLFGIYAWVDSEQVRPVDEIVVTEGQIEQLVVGFSRTWQRPPTQEELRGLIEDRIREEVLYREALAMGLDRDDTIVRRRMRQKLEFLTGDLASELTVPTEDDLGAYLNQRADTYRTEPKVSFEHISFSHDRRGESGKADAAAALVELNVKNGAALALDALGDATLLPVDFHLSTKSEVARMFGEAFAEQLLEVGTGRWSGPIESVYGFHLVRIRDRIPGSVPELANVRDAVLRDFLAERRSLALEAAYAKLRQRYIVIVKRSNGRRVKEPEG